MNDKEISKLLDELDESYSIEESKVIKKLKELGDDLPKVLLSKYRLSRKWQVRSTCLNLSIRYARRVEEAIQLGTEALFDKSKVVRSDACMLLAYSLDRSVLPMLQKALKRANDIETKDDINAALDAIAHQNHNYFVDREHTGKTKIIFH